MAYWLMKTEADVYSWQKLLDEGRGKWDGVRNPTAAKNLRTMKTGDRAFFYHTGDEKQIVGVMEVVREHYPDSTDPSGRWVMVDVKPVKPVKTPVTLAAIKADKRFAQMALVRYARLSVQPVTATEWKQICKLAGIDP